MTAASRRTAAANGALFSTQLKTVARQLPDDVELRVGGKPAKHYVVNS